MNSKNKRPKISVLHEEIPPHLKEFMQLTRLAEMGRLAANVAHEINNPLMAAQGFAENIEIALDKEDLSRDELRFQVLEIIKACHRMSRIVNKMNRMSRSQKLRLFVVDLTEVALNAVDFIKTQINDHDVQIEFDFDQPLPVKCDSIQIEQIILNILSNAIFALRGLKEQRRIRISFTNSGDWQQIRIWNNGPPIPDTVQARITDPYHQGKSEGEGSTLGLALSHAIMEVHGGNLSFTTSAENGTEFLLSLPHPKEDPWQRGVRQDKGPLVIIDTQAGFRQTMLEKFRRMGFQVEAFGDRKAGLEFVKKNARVQCAIVDIVPGQRESQTLVTNLRKILGERGLIFTMSGYPSARDVRGHLKRLGASECFEKPIHAGGFELIVKLLDSAEFAARDKTAA